MSRTCHGISFVLSVTLVTGCGLVRIEDDSIEAPRVGAGGAGGAVATGGAMDTGGSPSTGGALGVGGDEPEEPIIDTGTLRVDVHVSASGTEPAAMEHPASARIGLVVTVTERATGEPVIDAEVRGGPRGSLEVLPYDVYSLSSYVDQRTGYAPEWVFSVVRGDDRLQGLSMKSPTYTSVGASIGPSSGVITWSPAGQLGVTARVCATTINVPPPATQAAYRCVDASGLDAGAFALDATERMAMFPFGGTYAVYVERSLDQSSLAGDERSVVTVNARELIVDTRE